MLLFPKKKGENMLTAFSGRARALCRRLTGVDKFNIH